MQTANVNIPINVTGRHISVTEAMKEYAFKKIEGLHLDYPKIIEANVILDVEKHRHQAEIILYCANHITLETSGETEDMYASIDQAIDRIARRMRKYKTRLLKKHRPRREEIQHLNEDVYNLDAFDVEEGEPQVILTEKYPVKPMFVDEAALQMEVSTKQFMVFLNAATDRVNVMYRRKNNDLGLIQPVFE